MRAVTLPLLFGALIALSGCETASRLVAPTPAKIRVTGPPNAAEGDCYGVSTTPAIFETITEQRLVRPAEYDDTGTLTTPAAYRTEIIQKQVKPRQEDWFRTVCDSDMSLELVKSVQRALKARGLYRGRISGALDTRTRKAIRAYQEPQGLNSGLLSLAAARQLGLVAYQRPE